jgi:hypothetical protein
MAIRPILNTCVFVYLAILSGISGKIFIAEQVRSGYPKKTDPTASCGFLPQLQLKEIIGYIKIGFGNLNYQCVRHLDKTESN